MPQYLLDSFYIAVVAGPLALIFARKARHRQTKVSMIEWLVLPIATAGVRNSCRLVALARTVAEFRSFYRAEYSALITLVDAVHQRPVGQEPAPVPVPTQVVAVAAPSLYLVAGGKES